MKRQQTFAIAAVVLSLLPGLPAHADVVTDWGQTILDLAPASAQATGRIQTIAHAAMFDAVNAIDRAYVPYLAQPPAPAGASREAAAAAAAHARHSSG